MHLQNNTLYRLKYKRPTSYVHFHSQKFYVKPYSRLMDAQPFRLVLNSDDTVSLKLRELADGKAEYLGIRFGTDAIVITDFSSGPQNKSLKFRAIQRTGCGSDQPLPFSLQALVRSYSAPYTKPFLRRDGDNKLCFSNNSAFDANNLIVFEPVYPIEANTKLQVLTRARICYKQFMVDKETLSKQSLVFAAMFRSPNTLESQTGIVQIIGIEAPVVEAMLDFIFTGKALDLSIDISKKLFIAADRYEIESLMKALCLSSKAFEPSLDNVFELISLANRLNSGILQQRAMDFFKTQDMNAVMQTDNWRQFIINDPHSVLRLLEYSAGL